MKTQGRTSLEASKTQLRHQYWRKNLLLMSGLLVIWATVSLGCGVLLAEVLNQYRLFGYPLGFWFAQQGSIMTFVLLILIYCIIMNRFDAEHHRSMEMLAGEDAAP